jgi:hypothetical protein
MIRPHLKAQQTRLLQRLDGLDALEELAYKQGLSVLEAHKAEVREILAKLEALHDGPPQVGGAR